MLLLMKNIINIQFPRYLSLIRWDKPVGTLLLLWPLMMALCLASRGLPQAYLVCIFAFGALLTRSLGCILNDLVDKEFDRQVERTKHRPLALGLISTRQAVTFLCALVIVAAALLFFLNLLTFVLAIIALLLTILYPFLKRVTHFPQVALGFAFNIGILMAYAAVQDNIPLIAWELYAAGVLMTVAYDTIYALADRADDLKIGVKSTAIFWQENVLKCVFLLTAFAYIAILAIGLFYDLGIYFYIGFVVAIMIGVKQYCLLKRDSQTHAIAVFKLYQCVWLVLCLGVILSYLPS